MENGARVSAPVPVRPSVSPLAVSDDVVVNPFGEDFVELPRPDPCDDPRILEADADADVPQVVDEEWVSEIVEIHPAKQWGAKELALMLMTGLLLISVLALAKVLRRSPSASTATSAAVPILEDLGTTPQDRPERAPDAPSSGSLQAEFEAAEQSLQANDFVPAVERLEALLDKLHSSGGSDSHVRQAELMLAASYFGVDRASEAYQLGRKLAAGEHGQRDSALRLLELIDQRKQAEAASLFNTGVNEWRAGRADTAAENGRKALALLQEYGGTAEQTAHVEEFLAVVERGGSSEALRARTPDSQESIEEPAPTRSGSNPRRSNLSIDPKAPPVPRGRQTSTKTDESPASDSAAGDYPLSRHVRNRTAPQEERPAAPSSAPGPSEAQEPAPYPVRQPPPASSSVRDRSGSQDVLPTYNARTGGSAY